MSPITNILIALFAFAVVITFAIVFCSSVEVHTKDELRAVSCGWPVTFISTDQSWRDPPYPWMVRCLGGEWGDSIGFKFPQFAVDVIFLFAIGAFFVGTYRFIRLKLNG